MTILPRPKISVFITTSIDGYIAKQDGNIDWLTTFSVPTEPDEEKDYGFSQLFSTIDALVMGRHTYETVAQFDPWPYQGKRVIVLSSSLSIVTYSIKFEYFHSCLILVVSSQSNLSIDFVISLT